MRRRGAVTAALVLALAGCAAPEDGAGRPPETRVETFTVLPGGREFSLVVDEPGRPGVRWSGDLAGKRLEVTVGGRPAAPAELPRRRRELLDALDHQIDRLSEVEAAMEDVARLRRIRAAHAPPPPP